MFRGKIPVSVIMLSYNSEKEIENALKSVRWADEIIVIDSFSVDKTVEIARKYGAKIFQHDFLGFAKEWEFGIKKAKNEWVLLLATDEIIPQELANEIEEAIKKEFDGYKIPRLNYYLGFRLRFTTWPDYQLRLFKKSKAIVVDREVHEYVKVNGKVGRLKNPVIHKPDETVEDRINKMNRYTTLEARQMLKEGKKVRMWHLILIPLYKFIYRFLIRGGILDGLGGLICSINTAYYTYIALLKVMMYYKRNSYKEIKIISK